MMPKMFRYRAKKGPTDVVEGALSAQSEDEALEQLNAEGLFPLELREQKIEKPAAAVDATESSRISITIQSRHLIRFYQQFGQLLKSGVPILRALSFLGSETTLPSFAAVIRGLEEHVRKGESFSGAIARFHTIFPSFDQSLIVAGEKAGRLEESLSQIADYREKREEFSSRVIGSLIYPCVIILVGTAAVVYLLAYIIPQFSRFFTDLGQELPLLTRLLIQVSEWMKNYWIIFAVAPLCIFAVLKLTSKNRSQQAFVHALMLRMPLLGNFLLKFELARFCKTIELLLRSRIALYDAWRYAIPSVSNVTIQDDFMKCNQLLIEGKKISDGLKTAEIFPSFFTESVAIGEESGHMTEAFATIGGWYEKETDRSIKIFLTILEPLLILIIGVTLGLIVFALLMPIFNMSGLVSV